MSEQAGVDRILRMLLLLAGNRYYSITELGENLEISERTIYRYMTTLRDSGFLINKQDGCYRLDKESPYLRDIRELLHFTPEESWLLNRAILAIDDDVPVRESLARKLYSIYDLKDIPYPVIRRERSDTIAALIHAIEHKQTVRLIAYQSPNSSTVSDRLVEPYAFTWNYGYVWCYDTGDGRNKTFKTARIGKIEQTREPWFFEAMHEPMLQDLFRITGKQYREVEFTMSMRASVLLCEEFPMAEDYIEYLGEGCSRFKGPVCSFEGVGRFVLGLPNEISEVNPDEFRMYLEERIQRKKF